MISTSRGWCIDQRGLLVLTTSYGQAIVVSTGSGIAVDSKRNEEPGLQTRFNQPSMSAEMMRELAPEEN